MLFLFLDSKHTTTEKKRPKKRVAAHVLGIASETKIKWKIERIYDKRKKNLGN
jgi:hypothetical protein